VSGCGTRVVLTSEDLERIERHRAKGYEEHASYAIAIELPNCSRCHKVAARCKCPWEETSRYYPSDSEPKVTATPDTPERRAAREARYAQTCREWAEITGARVERAA
jgi:hypothetical protein